MKTINKILFAVAAAAGFTLVNSASADVNNDPNLLQNNANGNARAWEQTESTAVAPNANSDRDPDLLIYPSQDQIMPPRTLQRFQESATTGNYDSHRDPNLVSENANIAGTPKQKQFAEEQE